MILIDNDGTYTPQGTEAGMKTADDPREDEDKKLLVIAYYEDGTPADSDDP